MSSRPIRAVIIAIAAMTTLSSCRKERDPIQETIDAIVSKAEDRDAKGLVEHLSPTYRDASGMGRDDILMTLKQYLAGYEKISIRVSNLEIERAAESARATYRVEITGRARKIGGLDSILPDHARYDFEISLLQEGDLWNVSWASWKEVP